MVIIDDINDTTLHVFVSEDAFVVTEDCTDNGVKPMLEVIFGDEDGVEAGMCSMERTAKDSALRKSNGCMFCSLLSGDGVSGLLFLI